MRIPNRVSLPAPVFAGKNQKSHQPLAERLSYLQTQFDSCDPFVGLVICGPGVRVYQGPVKTRGDEITIALKGERFFFRPITPGVAQGFEIIRLDNLEFHQLRQVRPDKNIKKSTWQLMSKLPHQNAPVVVTGKIQDIPVIRDAFKLLVKTLATNLNMLFDPQGGIDI